MTMLSYIVAVTSAMCLHCQKGLPGIGRKCPVHCVPECWCRCSGTGGYGGQIQVFWTGKFHKFQVFWTGKFHNTQVFWTGKFHKIQVFWTGKYHCWEISTLFMCADALELYDIGYLFIRGLNAAQLSRRRSLILQLQILSDSIKEDLTKTQCIGFMI